jgi:single-strand DNA-binding protein
MAYSLNKVSLIGYVGQDPEQKYLPSGDSVLNFSLATSKKWKDKAGEMQEKTEWHRCVAWSPVAEILSNLSKGSRVYIEGELQTKEWTDQSGQKKYTTEVVVRDFVFLDGRAGGEEKPVKQGSTRVSKPKQPDFDTDLPF